MTTDLVKGEKQERSLLDLLARVRQSARGLFYLTKSLH